MAEEYMREHPVQTPCSDCSQPFEAHRKFLSSETKSYCHIPDTRHWYVAEPPIPPTSEGEC